MLTALGAEVPFEPHRAPGFTCKPNEMLHRSSNQQTGRGMLSSRPVIFAEIIAGKQLQGHRQDKGIEPSAWETIGALSWAPSSFVKISRMDCTEAVQLYPASNMSFAKLPKMAI